ncbi:MAG: hypothetical protein RIR26_1841 [Pseudomonadota bacterium]
MARHWKKTAVNSLTGWKVCFLSSVAVLLSLHSSVGFSAQIDDAKRFYRAGDFINASRLFYQVVSSSSGDVRSQAEFGLAQSLRGAGFPYGSSYFYGRIVQQGAKNDLFRPALEALSETNSKIPLGRANIAGLFEAKLDPLGIPPAAQGFYFYYKGLESFDNNPTNPANLLRARADFDRVPSSSPYYSLAQFYLGIIYSVVRNPDLAVDSFKRSQSRATSDNVKQLATMNLARTYYEKREYRASFENYSKIPRDSDLWLQTLLEGGWAFFMIQRHNNTLGNLHTINSPFYQNRFYPESYILSAITYLRLCRYESVKDSLKRFQDRYRPKFSDLNRLLKTYNQQYSGFYDLVARYRNTKNLREFTAAVDVVDSVSRSEGFKEGQAVVRGLDREKSLLRSRGSRFEGLGDVLKKVYEDLRVATAERTGQQAFDQAVQLFRYLQDLSNQTKLINLELLGGITDAIRSEYQGEPVGADKTEWGEGMKPLNLNQQLEYWPFEGEYWEDELGAYVYNIDSKCAASNNKGKAK